MAAGEDREFGDCWLHHVYEMIYAPEVVVYHAQKLTLRFVILFQFAELSIVAGITSASAVNYSIIRSVAGYKCSMIFLG